MQANISKDLDQAIKVLTAGDVVAIPTETVYGLAANIYDETAIRKIFKLKQRPFSNPLIVHLHSAHQLALLTTQVPDKAKMLLRAFSPGALTLILPKSATVPDLVTGGKNSVAVRIPRHALTLDLLKRLPFPLAAPSANPFMRISPTQAQHVADYFGSSVPLILDGGACQMGIESTIVGFEGDKPIVFRLGSISIEAIETVVGQVEIRNKKEQNPEAPGMFARHYSPRTHTLVTDNIMSILPAFEGKKTGLLLFQQPLPYPVFHQEILSPDGDFNAAAAHLYTALHLLDNMGLDVIIAQRLPDIDLGKSINDRLERAANKG